MSKHARVVVASALVVLVGLAGCQNVRAIAEAPLRDSTGAEVGRAVLREFGSGVEIALDVRGLKPGLHGFHLHRTGECKPPDFGTAGGHLNPFEHEHGRLNPKGSHQGDLPNLEISPAGTGSLTVMVSGVTLTEGPQSLLDDDGSSLVIHADPDDERTDPSGNSGRRIVCGSILELMPQAQGRP